MARTRKPETAAPETAQETQGTQDMVQDTQAQETAPDGAQEGAESAQETQDGQDVTQDTQAQETAPDGAQGVSETAQDLEELSEGLLTGYAVTGCDALNLREGPSLDARVVAVLPRDAGVFAEEGPEGGWLRVCTGWLSGYMMAKYLKPLPWPVLPHGAE